jgi:hypothetical protein
MENIKFENRDHLLDINLHGPIGAVGKKEKPAKKEKLQRSQ